MIRHFGGRRDSIAVAAGLGLLERTDEDLVKSRKSELWKVAFARWLREMFLAPNRPSLDRMTPLPTPSSKRRS